MDDAQQLERCINEEKLRTPITIEVDALTLISVHGYIALALRHPGVAHKPSSVIAANFAKQMLQACLEAGVFTSEGMQILARELYENDPRVVPDRLQV